MSKLDHPNICKYYETYESPKNVYLVMEYCGTKDLFDKITNQVDGCHFTERKAAVLMRKLLLAINHCHSNGVIHRDLKPENIMYNQQGTSNGKKDMWSDDIKIIDFGFAVELEGREKDGYCRSLIGTTSYMAPEILNRQPYQGHVVDLFALGVILFILYAQHPPFTQASTSDSFYKLLATNRADVFWKMHSQRHE